MKEIPQSVQEIVSHYSRATGIPCSIIDIKQETIKNSPCSICESFRSGECSHTRCFETHLNSALLSERFGGSYTYFCEQSLLHWVSPVYFEGRMEYAIIAGPVQVLEESEELHHHHAEEFRQFPHLEISRIHNMSEVLRMCAGWASGYKEHRLEESRTIMEIQAHAYEAIEHQKEEDESTGAQERINLFEKENTLQYAVRWGDRQTAQEIMNDILGTILLTEGNTLDRMKYRILELFILISRAAAQGGAAETEILNLSYRFQREISLLSTFEGMALWLSKSLHQISNLVFASREVEYGSVFVHAVRYIRLHYKEHLTLEETAQAVFLSPTYFSRLFKEKMNISFTSYVNQLRIGEAQRLLLDTRLTIIEIAEAVGFEDQSYFSKVFKEITKRTPTQYRKHAGSFPSDTQEIHR